MGAVQKVQKRRFTGAGTANHANQFARMKIETDAIQDGLLRAPGFAQVTYAQDLALPVGIGGVNG